MKQKETLTIIIVTFNSEKQIVNCIGSVLGSDCNELATKLTIVDNNSSDKTLQLVNKKYSKEISSRKIIIIKNKENIGFSRAVNLAIRLSSATYYALINPDVYLKKNTLCDIARFIHNSDFGIIGVKMVNGNGVQNGSYFRFPNIWIGMFEFTNLGKIFRYKKWHEYFYYKDSSVKNNCVDVVTGGFMVIRSEVIDKIGYFDEKYFMYLEDVDYCLKANKSDIKIGLCNTVVTHIGGASSANSDKVNHTSWFGSRRRYFLKNHSFFTNSVLQVLFIADELLIKTLLWAKTFR